MQLCFRRCMQNFGAVKIRGWAGAGFEGWGFFVPASNSLHLYVGQRWFPRERTVGNVWRPMQTGESLHLCLYCCSYMGVFPRRIPSFMHVHTRDCRLNQLVFIPTSDKNTNVFSRPFR